MSTPATFTFEFADHPWQGVPVVNGHEVRMAERIDVSIGATEMPVVKLSLLVTENLRLRMGAAEVGVDDSTRDALISLGWAPPAESGIAGVGLGVGDHTMFRVLGDGAARRVRNKAADLELSLADSGTDDSWLKVRTSTMRDRVAAAKLVAYAQGLSDGSTL